ncbi:hypothetical protein [Neisseria iguanae]|uniref:hypothetical protein n=1 Tax=Neisseria iguanae TaxID=90242 RepID=UPI0011B23B95|nr:hypothetical protein [Neisseria iguanae]
MPSFRHSWQHAAIPKRVFKVKAKNANHAGISYSLCCTTVTDPNAGSITAGNAVVNRNGVTITAPTAANPQNTVYISPIGLNNGGDFPTRVGGYVGIGAGSLTYGNVIKAV